MALVSSFMPKTTIAQMFPTNSKPSILHNKNVAIIRCAVKKPGVNGGSDPKINRLLQVTDRSLNTDQFVVLRARRMNNNIGEVGRQANAANATVVDDDVISNTTKIADATD